MKRIVNVILASAVVIGVAACSGLPYGFDNVSYFNIVMLKHITTKTQATCGTPKTVAAVPLLIDQAGITKLYIATAPADEEVRTAINEISGQIDEFAAAYTKPLPPSDAYCEIKMGIISEELTAVLTTIGNKR